MNRLKQTFGYIAGAGAIAIVCYAAISSTSRPLEQDPLPESAPVAQASAGKLFTSREPVELTAFNSKYDLAAYANLEITPSQNSISIREYVDVQDVARSVFSRTASQTTKGEINYYLEVVNSGGGTVAKNMDQLGSVQRKDYARLTGALQVILKEVPAEYKDLSFKNINCQKFRKTQIVTCILTPK